MDIPLTNKRKIGAPKNRRTAIQVQPADTIKTTEIIKIDNEDNDRELAESEDAINPISSMEQKSLDFYHGL
ncbi:hypothetical protein BpHYR1_004760 [Brachionus plicatilis]|uniref:Uncharacterized protein n=1 Tax=Brachionus plicatilis TaxID=10195 RepID=A0A3M7RRB9_BRAPC|nr:hypothetical protein BpHYR1_004760 [Brachionus plicatilis]